MSDRDPKGAGPDGAESTAVDGTPPAEPAGQATLAHAAPAAALEATPRFRITVLEGPGAGAARELETDRCSIGSHELNDVVLDDPTVSRFHCEIRVDEEGARVVDLRSKNGTIVDTVQVRDALLRGGCVLRLGRVVLRFEFAEETSRPRLSARTRFGSVVGSSGTMRRVFDLLERAAASDVTVLLEGETGTGKGLVAESIHRESGRADGPFVVVDCGAIPANLLESELFGHEKGAFTGAEARRVGAFEDAGGGTIFLDEIGELPADLQPKLLRALENREFRRVGSNKFLPADVRVVAATNRDLRAEVNRGRFRSDLYYRLAVAKISLPPLRDHVQDVPALVAVILKSLAAPPEAVARLTDATFLAELQQMSWPGNVRELRNYLERCLVFHDGAPPAYAPEAQPSTPAPAGDVEPYAEAKRRQNADWERRYLEALLARFRGRVAPAAAAAGIDRVYLYRLLRRHGMKP